MMAKLEAHFQVLQVEGSGFGSSGSISCLQENMCSGFLPWPDVIMEHAMRLIAVQCAYHFKLEGRFCKLNFDNPANM